MRLESRVERLELKAGTGPKPAVIAIQEMDDSQRVTGYRFGYGEDAYMFARKASESLDAFKERLREHVGGALLMLVNFVPSADGKPAWRNDVGPT